MEYSKTELSLVEAKGKKRAETSSHIIGWLVFFVGLFLIIWTLFYSYQIYTAKIAVPQIFQTPKTAISQTGGNQDTQAQLQNMINEQLKGLLPQDSVTQILNLAVFSILAFLLIYGGMQIASLGIRLIKWRFVNLRCFTAN